MIPVNIISQDGQYAVQVFSNTEGWVTLESFALLSDAQNFVSTMNLGQAAPITGSLIPGIINELGQTTQAITVPLNYEINVPFDLDTTGHIATISSQTQKAIQHILSLAFTIPGERVMLPNYGLGVQRLVFQNTDLSQMQSVAAQLQEALQETDGIWSTINVTVANAPLDPGTYVFSVTFTISPSPVEHQAVFDYQGNLVGES